MKEKTGKVTINKEIIMKPRSFSFKTSKLIVKPDMTSQCQSSVKSLISLNPKTICVQNLCTFTKF